jgi:hypothetical protein
MDSNDVKAFVDLESRRCPFEWIKQMAKLQLEEEERSAAIKA